MVNTKQVCVTGSNGFIGNQLIYKLENEGVPCFRWNKLEPMELDQSSVLVHLAARVHQMKDSSDDPMQEFREINQKLTVSLAQQALREGIEKFIFISTVKVIGEKKGHYDINSPCLPKEPYGISKWEAEQELDRLFSKQTKTQCIILRLPMVYGESNKGNMLSLLNAASKKIPLPLSSTKEKRSLIYVKNVVSAILKFIQDEKSERPAMQTYFVNDGLDLTSSELYSSIFRNMHFKNGVFYLPEWLFRLGGYLGSALNSLLKINVPISNEIVSRLFDEYRFSSMEFCRDYDWSSPFTPDEGIKNTVNWYLKEKSIQTK